ncbi:hypothetical protein BDV12DRAFT_171525 [Aspergillus spectabilis]
MRGLPQQTSRLIRIHIKYFGHGRTKSPSHDQFFMHDNLLSHTPLVTHALSRGNC